VQNLPDYPFALIEQRIRQLRLQGKDIIRFDAGNPDLPPPPAVIETLASAAARPDAHGYAGYWGTPEFRQAVARYYQRRFGVRLDPEREVLPLIGSKEGIVNFMLATVGPGDVVLVPSLAYPAYAMGAWLAEADVEMMPIRAEHGFLPVLETIPQAAREKARLLWLNYPNNPTGAFAPLDYYRAAVDFCHRHGIFLCSDNPYLEVVFDGASAAPSVLEVSGAKDSAVEFISMSKTYNMAGWRLGAAVGNAEALTALLAVKSKVDSGHFRAIYDAGVVALDATPQSWIDERNARYAARRDKIVAALPEIGLRLDAKPKGTLYVWAQVQDGDDVGYTDRSLLEAGVSIAPGSIYGGDGRGYVRLSLSIADEMLDAALDRLKRLWQAG
jgi:LL-diaminopimelate aminotransferase